MDFRGLGRSGLKVSALSLGTMNFGADWHGIGAIDEKTAAGLVDLALDSGVNLIDTADVYGRGAAETMLGKLLKKRRGRLLLATKVCGEMREGDPSSGGLSRKHISEGLEASLKRLKTDHVDLYMAHAPDPSVPLDESLEAFDRARRSGKVRVVGCSNFSGSELVKALGVFEFDQVQFSLAARFIETDLLPVCLKEKVGLLAWSPLGGGFLTGKYSGAKRPASLGYRAGTSRSITEEAGRPASLGYRAGTSRSITEEAGRPAGRRKDPATAFPYLPESRLQGLLKVLAQVARLEGVTEAQAALGWVLSKPWMASAIVGARTLEQLKETLAAKRLSSRSADFLDKASSI